MFSLYGEVTSNADVPFVGHGPADRLGSYVYARVPRAFGTRLTPGVYWTREYLDYARFAPGGQPVFLYDRQRHELRFDTRYELTDLFSASAGITFTRDRFSPSPLSPSAGQLPEAGQGTVGRSHSRWSTALPGSRLWLSSLIARAASRQLASSPIWGSRRPSATNPAR